MVICRHSGSAAIIAIAMLIVGCDSGGPSRTADEFAADSALAADLALANRDTLLVDSIGAYREANAAEVDTLASSGPGTSPVRDSVELRDVTPSRPAPAAVTTPQPSTPPPASSTPPATTAAAPKPAASKPAAKPAPKLSGIRACSSPTNENQSECIRVSIATGDARLNRVYRALITEMRRQEGVPAGAKDPPSVQRLRVAQRAWLVYRDTECRRRGRGKEGALWARPRARCLSEFAARRANELADNFSRLTAN
jgi:uncharacterized protein YecT (DUF1311 family)